MARARRANKARIRGGAITLKPIKHPHLPKSWLHQKLKLSHGRHTARVLPRHHTSYGILLLGLILAGWLVVITGHSALAGPPQSSSGAVNVSGQVVGPPPAQAAVITQPHDGQTFTANPIIVKGTCADDTFIELFRSSIFAGNTTCTANTFEISLDLVLGQNELVAKVSDEFNQYGPDSTPVKVTLKPLPVAATSSDVPSTPTEYPQLLLSTETVYRGVLTGRSFTYKLTVLGGKEPYAISIDWGDGKHDVVSQPKAGNLEVEHTYTQGGRYTVKTNVSDSAGKKALLQTVVVIVGSTLSSVKDEPLITYVPQLYIVAWPFYILLVCMISMFWLGERYQFHRLTKLRLR